MKNNINEVVASVLNVSPASLNEESSVNNVDSWDSLACINIAVAIEGEFAISLTAEDVAELTALQKIYTILSGHGIDIS